MARQYRAGTITSGAIPTIQLVSGTAKIVDQSRDTHTATSVTYNNSSGDATVTVALSPDNVTFSTLAVVTYKTFTNAVANNIDLIPVLVPAGWALKITLVNATMGLTTTY